MRVCSSSYLVDWARDWYTGRRNNEGTASDEILVLAFTFRVKWYSGRQMVPYYIAGHCHFFFFLVLVPAACCDDDQLYEFSS